MPKAVSNFRAVMSPEPMVRSQKMVGPTERSSWRNLVASSGVQASGSAGGQRGVL